MYRARSFAALVVCLVASLPGLSYGANSRNPVLVPSAAWNAGWASGDFDGDKKPDLAHAELVPLSGGEGRYRVQLDLSGGTGNSSFEIQIARAIGLNIDARDVDGDHDLDLVITSGIMHQPVGLWLNDGNGQFSEADSSLYSDNLWRGPPKLDSEDSVKEDRSALLNGWRLCSSTGFRSVFRLPVQRCGKRQASVRDCRPTWLSSHLYVRPPPFNPPFHF